MLKSIEEFTIQERLQHVVKRAKERCDIDLLPEDILKIEQKIEIVRKLKQDSKPVPIVMPQIVAKIRFRRIVCGLRRQGKMLGIIYSKRLPGAISCVPLRRKGVFKQLV